VLAAGNEDRGVGGKVVIRGAQVDGESLVDLEAGARLSVTETVSETK